MILLLYIIGTHPIHIHSTGRLSKSDSAPVRGDSYKPSLRSSDLEPTQRRCIACGQDLVVVVGVKGGGEKFSDGKISKTTTIGPL